MRNRPLRLGHGATLTLLICAALPGCQEESPAAPPPGQPPPATGWIIVLATVGGQDIDPDGFAVSVNGGEPRSLGAGAATVFADLAPGTHTVSLDGMAPNCEVRDPNPRTVAVLARTVTPVVFAISCHAHTTGSIRVVVWTAGFQTFGASLGGGPVVQSQTGEVVFGGLPPGVYAVELHIDARSCQLDQPYIQSHTVVAGRVTLVSYALTCPNPTGSLIVEAVTSGTNQPGQHSVYITPTTDGYCYEGLCRSVWVVATGQVRIDSLAIGAYYVWLRSLPRNCAAAPASRTVLIAKDSTARAAFSVSCV